MGLRSDYDMDSRQSLARMTSGLGSYSIVCG